MTSWPSFVVGGDSDSRWLAWILESWKLSLSACIETRGSYWRMTSNTVCVGLCTEVPEEHLFTWREKGRNISAPQRCCGRLTDDWYRILRGVSSSVSACTFVERFWSAHSQTLQFTKCAWSGYGVGKHMKSGVGKSHLHPLFLNLSPKHCAWSFAKADHG